jgi:hypothetical protein
MRTALRPLDGKANRHQPEFRDRSGGPNFELPFFTFKGDETPDQPFHDPQKIEHQKRNQHLSIAVRSLEEAT